MSRSELFAYEPDYAVPPGLTLQETLDALAMTQADLARRMGRPLQVINEIIKGKKAIEPETAIQLERAVGVPASFGNTRESQYRDAQLRIAEASELGQHKDWLNQFPWQDMLKKGFVPAVEGTAARIRTLFNFFAVSDIKAFDGYWSKCQASFRRSPAFETRRGSLVAWLRQGEIQAAKVVCAPYDEVAFKAAVIQARNLTAVSPQTFMPKLVESCAAAGVAVVCVPELEGGRESGATRWLAKDKALLQLSLRFKTNDHFWFSFFHEAGHILLHRKRAAFIDGKDADVNDPDEREADLFAQDTLIPRAEWDSFVAAGVFTRSSVVAFAGKLKIAPGIVAGRIMHDKLKPWNWQEGHHLLVRFAWKLSTAGA